MTNRVVVGDLRVAQPLYDFITDEALPAPASTPKPSGRAWTRWWPTSPPAIPNC